MEKDFWDKFNNIFKDFGKNFGDYPDDINSIMNSTPEDFMKGTEYTKTEETGTDERGNKFTLITYTSKDGKRKFTKRDINATTPQSYWEALNNKTRPQGSRPEDSSSSKNNNQLYTLEEELRRAVENQEFEKAGKLRDEIIKIKTGNSEKNSGKNNVEIIIQCTPKEDGTLEISKILQKGIKEDDRSKKQDIISNVCKKVIEKYKK